MCDLKIHVRAKKASNTLNCRVDQQKAARFESDFCVNKTS